MTVIITKLKHTFYFTGTIGVEEFKNYYRENIRCEICGSLLDVYYVYIIDKLKQKFLIPQNYEMMCCRCYNEEKRKLH